MSKDKDDGPQDTPKGDISGSSEDELVYCPETGAMIPKSEMQAKKSAKARTTSTRDGVDDVVAPVDEEEEVKVSFVSSLLYYTALTLSVIGFIGKSGFSAFSSLPGIAVIAKPLEFSFGFMGNLFWAISTAMEHGIGSRQAIGHEMYTAIVNSTGNMSFYETQAGLAGILAVGVGAASLLFPPAAPILLAVSAALFAYSNGCWISGEKNRGEAAVLNEKHPELKHLVRSAAEAQVKYAVFSTLTAVATTMSLVAAIVFPPAAPALLAVGMAVLAIGFCYKVINLGTTTRCYLKRKQVEKEVIPEPSFEDPEDDVMKAGPEAKAAHKADIDTRQSVSASLQQKASKFASSIDTDDKSELEDGKPASLAHLRRKKRQQREGQSSDRPHAHSRGAEFRDEFDVSLEEPLTFDEDLEKAAHRAGAVEPATHDEEEVKISSSTKEKLKRAIEGREEDIEDLKKASKTKPSSSRGRGRKGDKED